MRTGIRILAAVSALTLFALPAWSGEDGPPPTGKDKSASFAADMDKLSTAVSLTEEQKKKIQDLQQAQETAVAKWTQGNAKRVEALEKAAATPNSKNPKSREQAQRSLKALYASRDKIGEGQERAMFAVLTKEQRGKWNGPILNEAMTTEFGGLSLTDAQTQKIADLCKAKGEVMTGPADPKTQAAVYTALKGQIQRTILTPAQQKEYTKSHKTAAPARSSSGKNTRKTKAPAED